MRPPADLYASLYASAAAAAVAATAFGAPFAASGYLRTVLAGHGLLPNLPLVWPANVSFLQILEEIMEQIMT